MTDHRPNKLQRSLMRLDEAPAFMRGFVQNIILRRAVPFTGTAGVNFVSLTPERVEVHLANERRVQNHIGGVHASAMNLLAETATGMVVGITCATTACRWPRSSPWRSRSAPRAA